MTSIQSRIRRATARAALPAMCMLGALTACERTTSARARELQVPAARRLVGVWTVSFTLDPAFRIHGGMDQPVRGTLALIQDHSGRLSYPQLAEPLHYGTYDVDFRRFGFDPRDRGAVPVAVAGVSIDSASRPGEGVDHVRVVLDPGEAQMNITLDGTLAADSAAGTWLVESRTASGGGTFTMMRARP